jgi:hypothetical protein
MNSNYNYDNERERRKRGPFSIFILSYQLPPEPTNWNHPHDKHQYEIEKHHERKALAREWHRNPNRRHSVPPNVLV